MTTKVSFVVPSFNTAAWLPHAVKSCLEQSHKYIEVVIVDDCSTDTTIEYLNWLAKQNDKRIKIILNSENVGRSETRNIGNRAATGDIICVLDSDDLAVRTRAEWTVKKMKNGVKVIYGSAVAMGALGNAMHELTAKPLDIKTALETKTNGIVHSTMAYTKDIAEKYPYVSGDICRLGIDDWTMQTKMIIDGVKFDFIPDVICAYRVLGTGITATRDPQEVERAKMSVIEGYRLEAVK
jgi:glycosyltransferase involved in cell wall biosynthesis